MLNVLNNWCNKWRLTNNESQTKIVRFRNRNKLQSNFVFKVGEKVLMHESEYKCLGFGVNEHLDMEKSVTEVTKAASRALGAVYMKYLYAVGMTYEVYTKMIGSVVEPVLFYCSFIRGTRKFPKVQSVLNKAWRYFWGSLRMHQTLQQEMTWGSIQPKLSKNLSTHVYGAGLKVCQRAEQHIRFTSGLSRFASLGKMLC